MKWFCFFGVAQTILSVRGLSPCNEFKLQEFARIIFVPDLLNHTKNSEDHEPLTERPDYEAQDYPKIVRGSADVFSSFMHTILIEHKMIR